MERKGFVVYAQLPNALGYQLSGISTRTGSFSP
jgi:hypothetical protein